MSGDLSPDATTVQVFAWQITDTTGAHNKYYRAWVAGCRVVFQYGRIGTAQSTEVQDKPHPAAAISAATRKLDSKLNQTGKNYRRDGDTLAVSLDPSHWADPRPHGAALNAAFERAAFYRTTLAGSISDGAGHVVALVGTGRRVWDSASLVPAGALSATSPHHDVTVAAVNAKQAVRLDREVSPRVRLLDLGHTDGSESPEVLDAALRMWTPTSGGPLGHLSTCVDSARMIFA